MKKLIAMFLCLIMTVGLLSACGGTNTPTTTAAPAPGGQTTAAPAATTAKPQAGPFKIGVATIFEGEQWEIQKSYYETELGPTLNMNFMFSEKINDANALMDFIDQAYAAGCVGIVNYRTMPEDVAQGARKCESYGMYFVTQNSKVTEEVADLSHNIGHCGADPSKMGAAYNELFTDLNKDGQPHSIVIYSCAAVGQQAASHYYSVYGMLEAYQKTYNLTFDDTIDAIINRQEPGEVATGRDDLKIYIYPGLDFDAATVGVQTQLQTGEYDTFASCANFYLFTSAIDEVEKALKKDIRIVGTVNLDDQTKTGFETKDSLGNPILNAGMINPLNPANAINVIELYNALNGAGEAMKEGGKAVLLGVSPFVCRDAATYEGISKLDRDKATYVINHDDILSLMVTEKAGVTLKDLSDMLQAVSDVDAVLKKAGLK